MLCSAEIRAWSSLSKMAGSSFNKASDSFLGGAIETGVIGRCITFSAVSESNVGSSLRCSSKPSSSASANSPSGLKDILVVSLLSESNPVDSSSLSEAEEDVIVIAFNASNADVCIFTSTTGFSFPSSPSSNPNICSWLGSISNSS